MLVLLATFVPSPDKHGRGQDNIQSYCLQPHLPCLLDEMKMITPDNFFILTGDRDPIPCRPHHEQLPFPIPLLAETPCLTPLPRLQERARRRDVIAGNLWNELLSPHTVLPMRCDSHCLNNNPWLSSLCQSPIIFWHPTPIPCHTGWNVRKLAKLSRKEIEGWAPPSVLRLLWFLYGTSPDFETCGLCKQNSGQKGAKYGMFEHNCSI